MDQQHIPRPPAGHGPRDATPSGTDLADAVVGDAAAIHRPRRPEWSCQVCRQAWPCQEGKRELLAEYADDRVGLLVYLAGLLVDAVQDIDAPPNLLLDRFLRWAKIGEVP